MDCHIEPGYICRGGSPNNADNCLVYQPAEVTLIQTGQIRYQTKIMINVKLDYLPQKLLQSSDCSDRCSSVLVAEIISGDKGALSIKSKFIPGSSFSFSVEVDFGRAYIGQFSIEIQINPVVGNKFFGTVGVAHKLVVDVQPAYLSQNEEDVL